MQIISKVEPITKIRSIYFSTILTFKVDEAILSLKPIETKEPLLIIKQNKTVFETQKELMRAYFIKLFSIIGNEPKCSMADI